MPKTETSAPARKSTRATVPSFIDWLDAQIVTHSQYLSSETNTGEDAVSIIGNFNTARALAEVFLKVYYSEKEHAD